MRIAFLAAAFSLVAIGAAWAEDFVVVKSTDPSISKSETFVGGERVMLAPGASMTLVTPNGEVLTFRGARPGIVLPQPANADSARFAVLQAIIARPQKRRIFGAMRGKSPPGCPTADTLVTFEAILEAEEQGCRAVAVRALDAYLAKNETVVPAP